MTNQEAIQMLKSKLDGTVDTSYKWCECVRLAISALETTDTQNSQELIYKKACGVDVEASIEAQKSWEQWRDNVKAIQESNLLETEVEGLYLNFEQDGDNNA